MSTSTTSVLVKCIARLHHDKYPINHALEYTLEYISACCIEDRRVEEGPGLVKPESKGWRLLIEGEEATPPYGGFF